MEGALSPKRGSIIPNGVLCALDLMTIDMSQFHQVFFEEAAEHLENMEGILLGIDVDSPDPEDLNAIFRSAHSIKGGSATFGFNDVAEVTHVLETLLDRIRKDELALRSEMVDVFLEAGDVLKNLLAAHNHGSDADSEAARVVCDKLNKLTTGDAVGTANVPATKVVPPSEPVVIEQAIIEAETEITSLNEETPVEKSFLLEFDPANSVMEKIQDFSYWREELSVLGKSDSYEIIQVPLEKSKNTEGKRLRLRLVSTSVESEIRDAFAMIAPAGELKIAKWGSQFDEQEEQASDDGYGFFDEASPDELVTNHDDEGYGFFVDPLTGSALNDKDDTDLGYGFFDEALIQHQAFTAGKSKSQNALAPVAPTAVAATTPVPTNKPSSAPETTTPSVVKPANTNTTLNASAKTASSSKTIAKDKAPAAGGGGHAASSESSSIRVSIEKVDQLINQVGELVITQAMLAQAASQIDPVLHENLINGLTQLERNTRDLQESVMSIRMLPISFVFSRFPRMVRDLTNKLSKKVELRTQGEGTELDKSLIEKIADPLNHLVRNSIDHGIEPPDVREARGKDPKGTITLRASHQGGNIVIEIIDDGAGLSRTKIMNKARERGLAVSDTMTDQEVFMLIFMPGFSTAEVVTDVSGRGVGMDVVRRNIEGMGGRVEIDSAEGQGTRVTIRLPLTLAILDGLSVSVGTEMFIIPLTYIIESLQPGSEDVKTVAGQGRVVQVRGEYLPLIALHEVFNIEPKAKTPQDGILVLLDAENRKAALFVDALRGQHQVVIKSLDTNYRKVTGVSGATIMGDGRVALILDVAALIQFGQKR